jgi:hypothetical protein
MNLLKIAGALFVVTVSFTSSVSSVRAEVVWHPLPAEAYQFGRKYRDAQNLLFAFDYGHALVYERLLLNKGSISDPEKMEREIMGEIMKILKNPPTIKVDEGDIAPNYVYRFPLIINLFDWSHLLHQFVLDVLSQPGDRTTADEQRAKARINELFVQYKGNAPVAITDVCKTMLFMDGHYFSKEFRRNFPSFNLLIWSYHWFQIRLYEDLMKPKEADRDRAVAVTIKKFWELISNLPDSADFDMMPETAKEAPTFARAFPTIPAAFDNNHMLHDIVSDMLTSNRVALPALRGEGIRMGRMGLDPNAFRSNLCP